MGGWTDSRLLRAVLAISRWRYAILALLGVYWLVRWLPLRGGDWDYFVLGSDLLQGNEPAGGEPGGLHLYANYPQLQIGPLSFVLTSVFRLVSGGDGMTAAKIAFAAVGLLVVFVLERTAVRARGLRAVTDDPLLALATLAGGVLFMRLWIGLVVLSAHIDDATILAAGAVAMWAVATRKPAVAGLAAGVAIAAKPWGVLLLPLLLVFSGPQLRRAALWAVALAAAAWLPFVLGDFGTVGSAGSFGIGNDPDSALRVLGVHDPHTPHWLRPVQLGLGVLLASLAVWRRSWSGALLVAIAVRIALDPGVFGYYTAGLVTAALAWDLIGRKRPIPVWTLFTYFGLSESGTIVADPHLRGIVRLSVVALAIAGVLVPVARRRRQAPEPQSVLAPA